MQLEEAVSFIKKNAQKLLNAKHVILYPVSASLALQAKLSASGIGKDYESSITDSSHWRASRFSEFENFLYSFLDGSASTGMERMKLKLETPIGIAERLFSSCETLVRQDIQYAERDLASINEIVSSVKEYAVKMENETISWRRQALSLVCSLRTHNL